MGSSLLLALSGPCGAGKSTLAAALAEDPKVKIISEMPSRALGASTPYAELDVESIQRSFIQNRLGQVERFNAPLVVFDRSITEDAEVFLRLHRELGGLSESQFATLVEVARAANKKAGDLDASIIVSAEPNMLKKRISGGQRPQWLQNSFARQLELYQDFISQLTGPILEVDTTHRSLQHISSIAAWIVATVWRASQGEELENPRYGLAWKMVHSKVSKEPCCPFEGDR